MAWKGTCNRTHFSRDVGGSRGRLAQVREGLIRPDPSRVLMSASFCPLPNPAKADSMFLMAPAIAGAAEASSFSPKRMAATDRPLISRCLARRLAGDWRKVLPEIPEQPSDVLKFDSTA